MTETKRTPGKILKFSTVLGTWLVKRAGEETVESYTHRATPKLGGTTLGCQGTRPANLVLALALAVQPGGTSPLTCERDAQGHPVPEGEKHPWQDQGQSNEQEDLLEEQGKPDGGDNQAKQLDGYKAKRTATD